MRVLNSDIQLNDKKDESKNETAEKLFKKLKILSLKNSFKMKSLNRFSYTSWEAIETYHYQLHVAKKQKERKTPANFFKTKIQKTSLENCLSSRA